MSLSLGPSWSSWSVLVILVCALLAILGSLGLYIQYNVWNNSPWFDRFRFTPQKNRIQPEVSEILIPEAPPTVEKESWCFVGEDLSGRYCVKVPTSQACVPERHFASRSECELTPASHMPLGVLTKNGDGMTSLYNQPIRTHSGN